MKFSRLPLLSVAAFSFFAISASAADATSLPNLSNALSSQAAEKTAQTGSDNTNAAAATSAGTNTGGNAAATTGATNGGTTTGPSPTGVITGSGSAGATTGSIPSITGGSSATDGGGLPKGLPTLSGAFVIVAPSVPPTADAPFMRVSNLPEGTVFIVVGAVLGFMAMSVLLWRGLVAWSLHRSVKRAAEAQNMSHEKALFRTPAAQLYSYKDRESTISLGALGRKRQSARPTTAPGAVSQASLFFSPTAGAAGAGINAAGNRGSNYLPAGYYAAGAAQPGNGQGVTHIGHGQGNSISLSNLGPSRDGYARARSIAPSPPGSPSFHAHHHGASSSTLDLNRIPGDQRAPSAYLDDLFDSEGGPPVPGHQPQHRF